MQRTVVCAMAGVCLATVASSETTPPAKAAPLMTRWAKNVTPETTHAEYPRPQFVRKDWLNLNGLWQYAVAAKNADQPTTFDGAILTPFPVESALSGVMRRVSEKERLWYRRTFVVPKDWSDRRVLLHFGAVDWEATVSVNGVVAGTHCGGYDPFTFDITSSLREGENELIVAVWDPTDTGRQPRGKQVCNPNGIWYTPTTGIWRTVWLEPVPEQHIAGLRLTPDIDAGKLLIELDAARLGDSLVVEATALADGAKVACGVGRERIELAIPDAKLWSPDAPFLYDLRLTLKTAGEGGRTIDEATSYFGMRKIAVGRDDRGVTTLLLNNRPLFQYGLLDQGFWPDGLYTAPTDEALRYDLEITKQLGFNMVRKHIKVEPDRWYYWCDKLGLLVWQDMPCGGVDAKCGDADKKQFELELRRMIDALYNHPSIVMWVVFNEGWGQYDTKRIVADVEQQDPTRLANCASGWVDAGVGDVVDMHCYPGPASPALENNRAAVLGEFGGLGLAVEGHLWSAGGNWGYRSYADEKEATDAYVALLTSLRSLVIEPGLSAAVYTQTTDVEIEINGLMTYDRAVLKMDREQLAAAALKLYAPRPTIETITPTSEKEARTWRYTAEKPTDDWFAPKFDDAPWPAGAAGFGTKATPGSLVRTTWDTPDIWLRRTFAIATKPSNAHLLIHHDEDCEVYVNGKLAATAKRYSSQYMLMPLTDASMLRVGENTLAVHCHQTSGGQYIDVGIVDVIEAKE